MENLVYGLEPAVTIFAGDERGLADAAATVAAAGGRVAVRALLTEALARFDGPVSRAVLVHAREAQADALGPVLKQLDREACAGRLSSVVVIPEALIDLAAACAPHPEVALIAGGTSAEETLALGVALARRSELVLEERGDDPPRQLRRFREEVGRIARALAEMSGEEARPAPVPAPAGITMPKGSEAASAPALRQLIRARRQRDGFFPPDLFADPAWDMLLDLMLARMEKRLVAVSSLCIAAAVPPTTALRWIKRLTEEGLFIREADPRDGRRVFIDLSEDCAARMMAYLRSLTMGGPG